MSRRDRRDGDRRPSERRETQPDDDQQRRSNEPDAQESDSLTALKAILAKVAALLRPLQLSQDESIRLVEQLYGSVLDMDVRLAGEADDRRKASVLAHIQNTTVTRKGDKIAVEYPSADAPLTPEAGQNGAADTDAAGTGGATGSAGVTDVADTAGASADAAQDPAKPAARPAETPDATEAAAGPTVAGSKSAKPRTRKPKAPAEEGPADKTAEE